jgi:hypothetical protein
MRERALERALGAALLTRRGDFVAVSTAGPMRAFYERVRMRRGSQIAIVAVARKLAVLFWHLLTREQDYAFGRLSLTRKKLRALELRAGAERHPGRRDLATKNSYSQRAHRERERELSAARPYATATMDTSSQPVAAAFARIAAAMPEPFAHWRRPARRLKSASRVPEGRGGDVSSRCGALVRIHRADRVACRGGVGAPAPPTLMRS